METKTRVSLRLEDSLVKKIDGLKGKRKTRNQVISELLYKALEKSKEQAPPVLIENVNSKLATKAHKAAILTSKLAEVLIIQYVKNVETIYTEAKKRYRKEIEDIT
jgi:metal-responsive CopG/Arc/MetJ family transcriptional regulator